VDRVAPRSRFIPRVRDSYRAADEDREGTRIFFGGENLAATALAAAALPSRSAWARRWRLSAFSGLSLPGQRWGETRSNSKLERETRNAPPSPLT